MSQSSLSRGGTYVLVIRLDEPARITVGALGELAFAAGHYLYVGSALGGLGARLRRHLRAEKRMHWHVDYLLAWSRVIAVAYRRGTERLECAWVERLAALPGARACEAPFGASDCRCDTHLLYSLIAPPPDVLCAALGDDLVTLCLDDKVADRVLGTLP
jgi:Uri superfamily endonuclease